MAARHPGGRDAGYEQLVDSILIDLTSSFGADDAAVVVVVDVDVDVDGAAAG